MNLTKTQAEILAKAKKQPYVSVEMAGGRGPKGGRISYGRREYHAITSLIKAGALILVNTQRETTSPGNGATIHHYIIRARIA